MKLPNGESAIVDIRKLRDYSLNPDHELGRHKARVFRAALGLTQLDADWLRDQIQKLAIEHDAVAGENSPFGPAFVIDAELTFRGRSAAVRTAWIIEYGTEFPRLVSCYVL